MKKAIILFFTFTCIVFGAGINWVKDYEVALNEANKHSKPIFMLVESEDCYFCEVYKEETLSLASIVDFINKNYVPLKVMKNDGRYPADKLSIIGTPTTFFLNKEGQKYMSPILGNADKDKLMKKLKKGLMTR